MTEEQKDILESADCLEDVETYFDFPSIQEQKEIEKLSEQGVENV